MVFGEGLQVFGDSLSENAANVAVLEKRLREEFAPVVLDELASLLPGAIRSPSFDFRNADARDMVAPQSGEALHDFTHIGRGDVVSVLGFRPASEPVGKRRERR